MSARWLSVVGVAVLLGCGGERQDAASEAAADTAAMTDATRPGGPAATGTGAATRTGAAENPPLVVPVQEEVPGLLAQARTHPLDAQHIAQAKFPTGKVQAGWLERRGNGLAYRFRVSTDDGTTHDVIIDSFDGKIIITNVVRDPR